MPAPHPEVARDLFTEGGEAAVAIDAVAVRSGASVGSIYHHSGSKEGLLAGGDGGLPRRSLLHFGQPGLEPAP